MFNDRQREFLEALLAADVRFAIIGGCAVHLHGAATRPIDDLDLLISNECDNLAKLATVRLTWWHLRDEKLRQLSQPGARIPKHMYNFEILSEIDGVPTEEVLRDVIWISHADLNVPTITVPHLLINKRAVGEAKDLEDIDSLVRLGE